MTTTTITLRGREITRDSILAAIEECDRLGKVTFLRRYGFRESVRFVLRHDGRSYPSKAILGVAAGLSSREFFGGAAHTAAQLTRLGFHVRNVATGCKMGRQLDSLRRACIAQGLSVGERPWPQLGVTPTAYFASGSNEAPEIRGLSFAGADIGVAVPHVRAEAEAELCALAGTDVLVFVDSGAFSEVEFGPEGPKVVRPMEDKDWQRVLGLYRRLADALGEQVWVVAPDRVGCQMTSLERLERYRDDVRELHFLYGARVLVPVQKGELSQVEFAAAVDDILGFRDWVPALPCKKAATSAPEVAAFVKARKPEHVHLLGLGITNKGLGDYLAPFGELTTVSLDACWITGNAGRKNGRANHPHEEKGGARVFTKAKDTARAVIAERGVKDVAVGELAVYCCHAGGGLKN